ncbi:MAG: hypothetical protein HRU00_03515 [Myxococcales bacterium]|nr:hypothetical protein [Myxococcales bacterium]
MDPPEREPRRALLRSSDPNWLRFGRTGSLIFLIVGALLIVAWQNSFIQAAGSLDSTYRVSSKLNGYYPFAGVRFFYYLYYTGVFPVASEDLETSAVWSQEAAERSLGSNPKLVNELGVYVRTGDLAKIFLLYPHVWRGGAPWEASLMPFNRLLGIASLLALFVSLSLLQHRLLGSILILVLGSNPFQLWNLYAVNNVFAYATPVACLMLALHAPIILGRWKGWGALLLAAFAGLFLATVREVRSEPALAAIPVVATYLFAWGGWRRRSALLAVFVLSFGITSSVWTNYWDTKFQEAHRIVAQAGGIPFDGTWNSHHVLWHAVWCGLGDFDQKYGYRWNDGVAFSFAIPEVNRRFGTRYRLPAQLGFRNYFLLDYHTPRKKYRIRPETLDSYNIVVRDKVVSDVAGDPLWYLTILGKRTLRILSETPPLRLAVGTRFLDLPFSGWWILPLVVALTLLRRWRELLLLAYFLPASLTPLLIHSGDGLTLAGSYAHATFAFLICFGLSWTGRSRACPASPPDAAA